MLESIIKLQIKITELYYIYYLGGTLNPIKQILLFSNHNEWK